MTIFTLIAAVDKNGGIGRNNRLPWQIPEDLKHFKKTTLEKPVVMGRKTFESIGRTLPKRQNIVITRSPIWSHPEVIRLSSIEEVGRYALPFAEIFVIGGSEVYRQFLPHANRLILTEIDYEFKCDAFFPKFDKNDWTETSRETHQLNQYPFEFSFVEYERK